MMKPKLLKRRIIELVVAVVMIFSLFGFRLMDIQVVNGDYYEQRTQTVYTRTQRIKGARGEIMDRYGKSLAVNINGYDVVFNTVPYLLFDRELLEKMDSSVLLIDLASRPGGVDFGAAADLGVKTIWALSLPGKVAPQTSGEIIRDTIVQMLREQA